MKALTRPTPTDPVSGPVSAPRPWSTAIRRAPLLTFLVLSCLLSWWPGALQAGGVAIPGPPVTGIGPFLAAVIVLAVTQGRPGVGRLLRSMVHWRAPARAYIAALGLPMLVSGSAILLTLALGAPRPRESDLALWTSIPVVLVLLLLIPGTGGAWEEPGWRGFALGRFEKRFGRLAGPLVLGGFWVLWHAPLFVTGDILWPDVLVVIAASVVVGAVFHSGRDSVLIAMLFHATNNTVGGSYASQLFHGSDQTTLGLITAAGWWVIAVGVLVRVRRDHRRDPAADSPTPAHTELRPGSVSSSRSPSRTRTRT